MASRPLRSSGTLLQCLYAPDGCLDGALVDTGTGIVQWVLPPEPADTGEALMQSAPGQHLSAMVGPVLPAHERTAHPVYLLQRLIGKHVPLTRGVVMAFHYAHHGQPNGVVLENGDVIHTRPEGLARMLQLDVGDTIVVKGPWWALEDGRGRMVEATHINGVRLPAGPEKTARKTVKKAAKKAAKKATKKVAKKAAGKAVKRVTPKTVKKTAATASRKTAASASAAPAAAVNKPQRAIKRSTASRR